jgi:uncharacterized protein (DUF433 family)
VTIVKQTSLPAACPSEYDQSMVPPTTSSETVSSETVIPVVGEFIAVKAGYCGGKPHVIGHRIRVQHIAVWHERNGMTPEEIVVTNPTLTLPAVFAALAYYHSHRAEIDADIDADERFVAEMKSKAGSSKIQEKEAALHAKNSSLPAG